MHGHRIGFMKLTCKSDSHETEVTAYFVSRQLFPEEKKKDKSTRVFHERDKQERRRKDMDK